MTLRKRKPLDVPSVIPINVDKFGYDSPDDLNATIRRLRKELECVDHKANGGLWPIEAADAEILDFARMLCMPRTQDGHASGHGVMLSRQFLERLYPFLFPEPITRESV